MIRRIVLYLAMMITFICSGAELPGNDWKKAPPQWFNHYETALQEARKTNKQILVLQTGDWCGFCRKLKRDILDTKTFLEIADKNFVLVYLDIPLKNQSTDMPESQIKYNKSIQKQLEMGIGYPTVKIFDTNGELIAKRNGYYSYPMFMTWLYETVNLEAPVFPVEQEIPGNDGKKGSVRIDSWGYSVDKIDTVLHAGKKNEFACGRRIYFKVEYEPPEPGMELRLYTWAGTRMRYRGPVPKKKGTYIFFTDLPLPSAEWYNFSASILPIKKGVGIRKIYFRVKCNISDKDLTEEEKIARKEKIKATIKASRFQIVSWGLDRKKVDRPFSPDKPIIVKTNQKVYFKIRYKIPMKELTTYIWMKCPGRERDCGTDTSGAVKNQGEIVRFIVYGKPVTKNLLQFSFRPVENAGYFASLIELPCNITWEE